MDVSTKFCERFLQIEKQNKKPHSYWCWSEVLCIRDQAIWVLEVVNVKERESSDQAKIWTLYKSRGQRKIGSR